MERNKALIICRWNDCVREKIQKILQIRYKNLYMPLSRSLNKTSIQENKLHFYKLEKNATFKVAFKKL